MSIDDVLSRLIEEGELCVIEPLFPGEPVSRCMLVAREIAVALDQPEPRFRVRMARLRAELEQFVLGGVVGVCCTPYQAEDAKFGVLSPPSAGVLDFRSQAPSPSVRLIGGFAKEGVFVALVPATRSQTPGLFQYENLGDRNSDAWKRIIRDKKARWRKLFQSYPPMGGIDVSKLLGDDNFYIVG